MQIRKKCRRSPNLVHVLAVCSVMRYVSHAGADEQPRLEGFPEETANGQLEDKACDGEVHVPSMEGTIEGVGFEGQPNSTTAASRRICTWIVDPDVHLDSIEIVNFNSVFGENQLTSGFGKPVSDSLQIIGKNDKLLAKFSNDEPMPSKMKVVHSDILIIRLVTRSADTK